MFTNVGVWAALSRSSFVSAPRIRSARTVDVLIPTFGEPLSVLRDTVAAAVVLELPHRTVVSMTLRGMKSSYSRQSSEQSTSRGRSIGTRRRAT